MTKHAGCVNTVPSNVRPSSDMSSNDWDLPYYSSAPTETVPQPPTGPPAGPPPPADATPPPPRPAARADSLPCWPRPLLGRGRWVAWWAANLTDNRAPVTATATTGRRVALGPSSTIAGPVLDTQGILAKAAPAVVTIRASGLTSSGAGTGIILTADGEVLTNAHVVRGATTIRVRLDGESQSRQATVIGSDGENDLALLKIANASGLPTAELGDSDAMKVGDDVVAIGNALDLEGDPTVTRGIVSATDRSLDTLTGLLQHDATINPGNSGGPLLNRSGQVIGINTATAGQGTGIGFAIPINHAKDVIARLRQGQTAAPVGWLGVQTAEPDDGSRGALVVTVVNGEPADAAGLREGDLITAIDGKSVSGAADLRGLVRQHRPGQRSTITVTRNGQSVNIDVTFGSRPSN